jgi:bacteriorhodopsin
MADIDVVKKRTSVWPWVFGLLLLVLIVWVVISMAGTSPARTGALLPQSMPTAVAASA